MFSPSLFCVCLNVILSSDKLVLAINMRMICMLSFDHCITLNEAKAKQEVKFRFFWAKFFTK